tara:strand:+ start:5740 stop:7536 length:1797 start_codon:yes stop_codon:yes gene_type:complete
MAKDSKKLIRYTNRDFDSIKDGLLQYAKRYYPNVHKDFSEASFGSMMLDTVAYVGDVLSFYLDYQANESFVDTAIEYDNVLRLGQQVGYKEALRANAFGLVSLYVLVPSDPVGTGPDSNYIPILAKDTKVSTPGGNIFTLIENVDFSNPNNEVVVATSDSDDGSPTSFAIKAYGKVMSGELKEEFYTVGDFARFLNVPLGDANITEVVSVTDTEGHEYFEVPYLSQDTVFRSVVNKDSNTRERVPSVLVATSVPRRYTVFVESGRTNLKFGYGSESSLKSDLMTHPSNVVLKMHGRDYETDNSFDPSKLLESDKFGIAPANTTLRIVYRSNTNKKANAPVKTLTNISNTLLIFGDQATNQTKVNFVKDSLECINEEPVVGDVSPPSLEELRQRVNDTFATQNRAVTADDYIALVYRMPGQFGKIKRAKLIRDHDSFKKNLNLYVVSEDSEQNLIQSSTILKNNIKTWINQYRMINDTVDILDARIFNIGINFTAVVNYDQEKFEALNIALTTLQEMFVEKFDVGQPIYITKIYDVLNQLDEIVDVVDVEIVNKTGGLYSDNSLDLNHFTSADGRILYAPENAIYEFKYPDLDFQGTIR